MYKTLVRAIVLGGIVLGIANVALADEMVDNINYKRWAQFKPGTFVVTKMVNEITTEAGVQKTESTVTTTLKQVTKEKVVVTVQVVSKVAGQEFKAPPQDMDYPAKIKKEDIDDVTKARETPEAKKGKESIEIAGKKMDTEWVEVKIDNKKMTGTTKIWECKDIPGGIAKMKSDLKKPIASKTTMTVIKFEVKK